MPISGLVLGPELVSAAGSTDAPGIAGWTAIGGVIGTWLITGIPTPTLGVPLVAAGVVVTGQGGFVYADGGSTLGVLLAAAAGSVDPVGLAKWNSVGLALGAWLNANAIIDPTTLVAVPGVSPQPLGGVGAVAFLSAGLGTALANAVGATDTPGIERWGDIGDAIIDHMQSFGVVNPGAMMSPGPGGPVTGVGILL